MRKSSLNIYRCPVSGGPLKLNSDVDSSDDVVVQGELLSDDNSYEISNGIANFAPDESLTGSAKFARDYYATIAHTYDENVHVTFDLYGEDERGIRERMIDLLQLSSDARVLEISAGTGKDSELIAKRLSEKGELWLLDISPQMIERAQQKLSGVPFPTEFTIGNACSLPFADNSFDALFCFAGIGHFPDTKKGLSEMARVVRKGGRVVFCEKNVPPWLLQTTYGKILINNNPMFAHPAPLDCIPTSARDVGIRWINGDVHYVVDYTVGEGAPSGAFDLELPGHRGGTFNTRYFGKLEGVTPETKALYEEAASSVGKSLHVWLDEVVRAAALRDLRKSN